MSEKHSKGTKKIPEKKYLFAILDSETHEFKFALRGTRIAAIVSVISIAVLFCTVIYCLVAFTPVKLTIPGYPSYATKRMAIENAAKVDSIEQRMRIMTLQLTNIRNIIAGKPTIPLDSLLSMGKLEDAEAMVRTADNRADSILRERIDSIEKYNLRTSSAVKDVDGLLFFPPVKGVVTEPYSLTSGHPFIDIAIADNTAVRSVLDGTVIAAYWSDDTGYNIHIQHSNNLVSIYKHNTKLLKKTGDKVSAGSTISLAGDAGSTSTGPHLHFELWHNGSPIDPSLYISF